MIKELLDLLSLGYYSKYRNNRVLLKQSSLMHEFGLEILDLFHRISLEQKKRYGWSSEHCLGHTGIILL